MSDSPAEVKPETEKPDPGAQHEESPPDPQVTKSVTVGENLEGLLGDLETPEVQPHAVEAARERRAAAAQTQPQESTASTAARPVKGKSDNKGRAYDPAIHETGPDGKPLMNAEGYIKCKRGGAAQKVQRAAAGKFTPPTKPDPTKPAAPNAEALEAQVQATGATAAVLVVSLAQMVGGEDFKPETGEAEGMAGAFANYFRSKGISDIPPGTALAITLAAYIGKRWNRPKFAEKRKGLIFNIKRWWNDFRFRRAESDKLDDLKA